MTQNCLLNKALPHTKNNTMSCCTCINFDIHILILYSTCTCTSSLISNGWITLQYIQVHVCFLGMLFAYKTTYYYSTS